MHQRRAAITRPLSDPAQPSATEAMLRYRGGISGDWVSPKLQPFWLGAERGHGLIAVAPVEPGELMWVSFLDAAGCDLYRWEQICGDPEAVAYSYQIAPDLFSLSRDRSTDRSNLINHSCDPSLRYHHGVEARATYFLWRLERGDLMAIGLEREATRLCLQATQRLLATGDWLATSSSLTGLARRVFLEHLLPGDDPELVVARRALRQGEEATLDYGMFWTVSDQPFDCRCGSSTCRGQIRATDYRLYGDDEVSPYVRRLMRTERRAPTR